MKKTIQHRFLKIFLISLLIFAGTNIVIYLCPDTSYHGIFATALSLTFTTLFWVYESIEPKDFDERILANRQWSSQLAFLGGLLLLTSIFIYRKVALGTISWDALITIIIMSIIKIGASYYSKHYR